MMARGRRKSFIVGKLFLLTQVTTKRGGDSGKWVARGKLPKGRVGQGQTARNGQDRTAKQLS